MARNKEELRAAECSEQSACGNAENDEKWEVKTEEIIYFYFFKLYL